MFGRLNDVRNKVLIGSRYVAWERTVWINPEDTGTGTDGWWYEKFGAGAQTVTKTDEVLRREFLARVVAPRRTSISGTDADMPLSAALPPSWRDPGGTAFVRERRDVMVSTRATDRMLGSLAKIANRPIGVYRSPHVEQEVSLLMGVAHDAGRQRGGGCRPGRARLRSVCGPRCRACGSRAPRRSRPTPGHRMAGWAW
ncbi:hypothetical protein [Burkholderia gladioli]|uniref:hypothetical protein n=1 Tax=Burkholderia gladioli TaxID=28095 RepID=UPI003D1E4042